MFHLCTIWLNFRGSLKINVSRCAVVVDVRRAIELLTSSTPTASRNRLLRQIPLHEISPGSVQSLVISATGLEMGRKTVLNTRRCGTLLRASLNPVIGVTWLGGGACWPSFWHCLIRFSRVWVRCFGDLYLTSHSLNQCRLFLISGLRPF